MRSTPVLRFSAAHFPPPPAAVLVFPPYGVSSPASRPIFLVPLCCAYAPCDASARLGNCTHTQDRSKQWSSAFSLPCFPLFFSRSRMRLSPDRAKRQGCVPVAAREWPFYPQSTRKDKGRVGGPPVVRLHDSAPVQDNNERAWDSSFVCLPFLHSGLFASRHAPSHDFFYSVGAPLMLLSYSDLLVFRCFAA